MKFSRQRKLIHDYLLTDNTHPTADTVYAALKPVYPALSLGTVYRNLALLSNARMIKRLNLENSPCRFDGNTSSHYHGVCIQCGAVADLYIPVPAGLEQEAASACGLEILGHNVIFDVVCAKCADKT